MNEKTKTVVDAELGAIATGVAGALNPVLGAKGMAYVLVLVDPQTMRHTIRSNADTGQVVGILDECAAAARAFRSGS